MPFHAGPGRLGFTEVNNSDQKYRTTGFAGDNSFYDPAKDRITFGTGGVDDAEDAEVIWHEYGQRHPLYGNAAATPAPRPCVPVASCSPLG